MTVREVLKAWKKDCKKLGIMDREIDVLSRRSIMIFLKESMDYYDRPVYFKLNNDKAEVEMDALRETEWSKDRKK